MLTAQQSAWMLTGRIAGKVALRIPMVLLLTFLLVCLAPGFDSDERQLDVRLSAETIASLRQARSEHGNPIEAFGRYVGRVLHGDFGQSVTFQRPVSELLVERSPLTFRAVGIGAVVGWLTAAILASSLTLLPSRLLQASSSTLAGMLLCVPSAMLGFAAVAFNAPLGAAMSCVVFSRVFLQMDALFRKATAEPHVLAAQATGMSPTALFRWHIAGANVPQIVALAASSISIALGAAVPLEVICDAPGLGQLAWRATLGRDLSVLLGVTLIIAAVNTLAAATTDAANGAIRSRTA